VDVINQVLSEYLSQLLDTNQLRGQEFFDLLSWMDTYKSEYFMGHPNLHLDTSKLPDLLDQAHFSKALSAHLDHTKNKIAFWFQNAMDKNFKEWLSNVTPYTIEGNFESSMPNDINTMLIQQVFLNCAVLNLSLKILI
jgi:hypothetical protein